MPSTTPRKDEQNGAGWVTQEAHADSAYNRYWRDRSQPPERALTLLDLIFIGFTMEGMALFVEIIFISTIVLSGLAVIFGPIIAGLFK